MTQKVTIMAGVDTLHIPAELSQDHADHSRSEHVPSRQFCQKCNRYLLTKTLPSPLMCNTRFKTFRGRKLSHATLMRYLVCFVLLWLLDAKCQGQIVGNLRQFPPPKNVAKGRPISTIPTSSTCGMSTRNAFCVSSESKVQQCEQEFCEQTCGKNSRTDLPSFTDLLRGTSSGFSRCLDADPINVRPGSETGRTSTYFTDSGEDCYLTSATSPSAGVNGSFTLTAWIWLGQNVSGTLVEKYTSAGTSILKVLLGPDGVSVSFYTQKQTQSAMLLQRIPMLNWTHLAVQVYMDRVSFFINGMGKDYMTAGTVFVEDEIADTAGTFRLGQSSNGLGQFIGRMQEVFFFSTTLSNREVQEVFSGTLPTVRIQNSCRCPPATPRVKPQDTNYCLSNGVPDNAGDATLRISETSHPVEYANDGDVNTIWISNFQRQVELEVDLGDQFEVFHVGLEFYSPQPKAIVIKRLYAGSNDFQPWQYFAENCTQSFGMPPNGTLETENSVNCIEFDSEYVPYSKGITTFTVISTTRPGYTKYYDNPALQQFVQASRVKVLFQDHFYAYNIRHEYFALFEFRVSGRCGCNGHAASCSTDTLPYKCVCTEESYTQGDRCNECQPLYNMKPFRQGGLKEAFNCRYCDCHNHADSCVYNATVDPYPTSWTEGGGGVCVNCRDNTEGQLCDQCIDGYFRPMGKSLYVADMCSPCTCNLAGTVNAQALCVKEGGQCPCKASVTGRACDQCVAGSYNLQATDIDGCTPCHCNTLGTITANKSCDQTTGFCFCKQNVRGKQCDLCEYGFYSLTEDNPYGCTPCICNAEGSLSMDCNPSSGQCQCKQNVQGSKCDQCMDNFYNFSAGCLPCNCDPLGTHAGTTCDKNTGQCVCKLFTSGRQCDQCKPGSSGFGNSSEYGCIKCSCDERGVAGNSTDCSGGCVCKQNVMNDNCNICKPGFFNLTKENELGCVPCDCDPTGIHNNVCGSEGECICLDFRTGPRCETCEPGYYRVDEMQGGCQECNCTSQGIVPGSICDSNAGNCSCRTSDGVKGFYCNECIPGYHSFELGKCTKCQCSEAGSISSVCHQVTGQCTCKKNVEGDLCDKCIAGASDLNSANELGCSTKPSQQPPPIYEPLSPTSMKISWSPPDSPNGKIMKYELFRDDEMIYSGSDQSHVDEGLHPYTVYSYFVRVTNDAGSATSPPVLFRTLPGVPSADIQLTVDEIKDISAKFSWTPPSEMNGPLQEYQLISKDPDNATYRNKVWDGIATEAVVESLGPYQRYYITVSACTAGGCTESGLQSFITRTAAPTDMPSPTISIINSTSLYVEWKLPQNPNGIIRAYELWIRGANGQNPVEKSIFRTTGYYDPLNATQSIMEPPTTFYIVTGLQPFTAYEFQVVAENEAGRAASIWTEGRTQETYPVYMPPPQVIGVTSSVLQVSWLSPSVSQARGNITIYRVYQSMTRNLVEYPFSSPTYWLLIRQKDGLARSIQVTGLKPYTSYTFMVEACNDVGCVNSSASAGSTLSAAPEGMTKPIIDSYNSTVMEVKWHPPTSPNGPTPRYTVQKTNIALSYPASVVRGTRFPGGGYYAFPKDTLPQNVDFTGIRFEFRLQHETGLLMFAASENHQEYIAVVFNSGRPKFYFDTQGLCEVEVNATQPDNVNLTDGQVHTVKVVRQDGNIGSILVDGVYSGCGSFPGVSTFDDEGLIYNDGLWHHFKTVRFDGIHANVTIDHRWTGCTRSTGVETYNDEGLRYDGNNWHTFEVIRRGITGTVIVDKKWKGNGSIRDESCKESKIIALNTDLYVGGVPPDFVLRRDKKTNGILHGIIGKSFQGCIHKVEVLKQMYPDEVWEELKWANAVSYELAFLNWQGCPINLDSGIHFMGKGYAAIPLCTGWNCLLRGDGTSMKISFKMRTALDTGLLFIVHGGKGIYLLAYMQQNSIVFEFNDNLNKTQVRYTSLTKRLCDAQWHTLEFLKINSQGSIRIDGGLSTVSGDRLVKKSVLITSPIYMGGVKPDSDVSAFLDSNIAITVPAEGFGGCIKELEFGTTDDTDPPDMSDVKDIVNVNLDGCPPFHTPKDTCKGSLITDIYTGSDTTAYDYGLLPYTDYIYRVVAKNSLGEASSPWGYGRTREGAPVGVGPPTSVQVLSGYMVEVEWEEPQSTSGLLIKTIISAYSMDDPELLPVSEEVLDINVQAINLTDVTPNTNYRIKISACTSGGCTESLEGVDVRTPVEAPEDVGVPRATTATATVILVAWDPPSKPNGNITGYLLYKDGLEVYNGGETQFLAADLRVYTSYQFYVRACTTAGCTDGPRVSLSTAQLPPSEVKKPVLTVLGARSIEVNWEEPELLNGVLERYIIFLSTEEGQLGKEAYNNTITLPNYVLQELTAGTTYYISVAACTGGGCTVSNASIAKTSESSPGGISNPKVTSPSSSQLIITWEPPEFPNGVISYYALYQNEVEILRTIGRSHQLNNLQPYSLHFFRLKVCTTEGCGFSEQVSARTQEAPPQGVIVFSTAVIDARTVNVSWTAPENPNGQLFYDVYFNGNFYADPENWNYTMVRGPRSMLRETTSHTTFQIQPLIPRVYYEAQVNASNTKGFILSNTHFLTMPAGSPDGVKPPEVVSDTSGSMSISWQPVGRVNGNDDERVAYLVQFRQNEGDVILDDYGPTTTMSYRKTGLRPFTSYQFRVVASNSFGSTPSPWVTSTTLQDRPSGVPPPIIALAETRSIHLEWTVPTNPNGIITAYKIYQTDQLIEELSGNVTSYVVTGLTPYQLYVFKLEACTVAGCTLSDPSVSVYTQKAVPEGIAAPVLKVLTPASIDIQWSEPLGPNGVISRYILERKVANETAVTTVGTFLPSAVKRYVDDSSALSPFTSYSYRVKAVNDIGEGAGPWANATTSPSRPAGVTPPVLTVLNATSIRVSWTKPLQSNGIIEYYLLEWEGGRREHRNFSELSTVLNDLTPYTQYSIKVAACTNGGCTESTPTAATTLKAIPAGQAAPTATAISQSAVSVLWSPPSSPNGPNLTYELARRLIRRPLDSTVTQPGQYGRVYFGTQLFFEDRGLPMFTTFTYRVTAFNDVGQTISPDSAEATTYGGFPTKAPLVSANPMSHLEILVNWTMPDPVELQGEVQYLNLTAVSNPRTVSEAPPVESSNYTLQNLSPRTEYKITLKVTIFGGSSITSEPVTATTLDGAPEGIPAPVLAVISNTALRVTWIAPEQPNGVITTYNIIVNGETVPTGFTLPASKILDQLQPYTVYEIKVEACTVFQCGRSDSTFGTTAEALPMGMAAPVLTPLNATAIQVDWQIPTRPNGIVLRYDLWRKTIQNCTKVPTPEVNPEDSKCTYVECGVLNSVCGGSCYTGAKTCCDGELYDTQPGYGCCDTNYLFKPSADSVCCAGKFYEPKANFTCCGRRYLQVLPNEICCTSPVEDRVAVGQGDSCCAGVPYSSTGSQICCDGALVDGFGRQCCGGYVVSNTSKCCGDATAGRVYMVQSGYTCCGQMYSDSATSLCCQSDTEHTKVHHYDDELQKAAANEVCCGLEKISSGLSCCNYVGYNPFTQICADRGKQITGCGTGMVCPITQGSQAFCNRCDFNHATTMCGFVPGHKAAPSTPAPSDDSLCFTGEEKIYTGLELSFIDGDLMAYHKYQYSVRVVNSAGTTSSPYVEAQTTEAPPAGVAPPVAHINPEQLQIIFLSWTKPQFPNGEIIRYILLRDGIELYRGLGTNFTDDNNVLPYKTYIYMLTACTMAGCTNSPGVTVATAQGVPEDLKAPVVTVLSPNSMLVSIQPPGKPNGEVVRYTVLLEGKEEKYSVTTPQGIALGGLEPYTSYTVYVEVCTLMGCADSPKVMVTTKEAVPEGVDPPTVVVMTASSVDVYWKPPDTLNGQLQAYTIILREISSEKAVYRGTNLSATISNLLPGRKYDFVLNVSTNGGTTRSQPTTVTMPTRTPLSIPPPQVVAVLSSSEINVDWSPVVLSEGTIDQYFVLLNLGQETESITGVGTETSLKLSGLQPYTEYSVRLQACLQGVPNGCGTSSAVVRQTHEAAPSGQPPPTLTALAPNSVKIEWKEPANPNGVITFYRIFQRTDGASENRILVDQVGGNTFSVTHTGQDLKPYTLYQYGVSALNSKDETDVSYSSVRTLQSPPIGFNPPSVTATGAYSIAVAWAPPSEPNGVISEYKVHYKTGQSEPESSVTVAGTTTATSVSNLEPYSLYTVRVEAINGAGSVSSPTVDVFTKQASPSGLRDFTVEKITSGDAVILRWDPPLIPNGIITIYRIFEVGNENSIYGGVARVFEYRRLQPYTEYSVKLEACTVAGCTLGEVQKFWTAEIPPGVQPIPTLGTVTATSVVLRWAAPLKANGKITSYEVVRRSSPVTRRKREVVTPASDEEVVYRTMDTDADTYEYTDTNLQPHTQYQYKVRTSNSQGSTDSPWQTVQTSQAAPEGVAPPQATHVDGDVNSIKVSWLPPASPNGVLQSYRLQRNDTIPLSLPPDGALEYVYGGLQPYTWYSFTLTACSGGGCTTSVPTVIRTKEAAPLSVSAPALSAVDATSIKATWVTPQVSNGVINLYNLTVDGAVVYSGLEMEYIMSGLVPYKEYAFHLTACTEGGCTQSEEVVGRPEDYPPADLDPPVLRVISSTAIEISWAPPKSPNGVISSYDVRREGNLVFTDSIIPDGTLVTVYTDYKLQPGENYTYTIVANNRKGSVESSPSSAKTFSDSPGEVDPPKLTPLSSTSIQADWTPPIKPNGQIVNYTLLQGNELVYSGDQLKYVVQVLSFFTQYTFRVQACTLRGCTLSPPSTATTMEALPQKMEAPVLKALAGETGAHKAVYVKWTPPVKPNGVISRYQLQRRTVIPSEAGVDYGDVVLVYDGIALEISDEDPKVLPYRSYQYMVIAFNAAGKAYSPWAEVTTKQAPPAAVDPPVIVETTATTITVNITAPQQPNGVINLYNVHINGTVRASGLLPQLTAGQAIPLVPFTAYSVSVQACTSGGCTDSLGVIARTTAAQPSGLDPLVVSVAGSTAVTLTWKPPEKPNGVIRRYLVYQRTACPHPPQPFTQTCSVSAVKKVYEGLQTSTVVSGLIPYSNYQFMLQVENQVGQLDFPEWVSATTIAAVPQYIASPRMMKNGSHAVIDWSNSFSLNGQLREYMMRREGYLLYRGMRTVYGIQRASRNEVITFELEVITNIGNAVSPPIIFDPSAVDNTGTTQAPQVAGETPVYEEVWFIIVIIIVLLLLLFILLAVCLRHMGPKEPYIRERMPLPSDNQKVPRDLYVIDATDGTVIDATLSPSAMSGGNTMYQGPGVGMVNPAFDSTLPRLQTLSLHGSKTSMKGLDDDDDDVTWDRNFDSGLFDTDDDVDSLNNPAYSYTKEQTVFTDTHL